MIDRVVDRFGLHPGRLAGDSAYGAAPMLAWLVTERGISPHIPVFDKSSRDDGTLSRADLSYEAERNLYVCPQGKLLRTTGRVHDGRTVLYRSQKTECDLCSLKPSRTFHRKIPRDINEDARDVARSLYGTPAFEQSRRDRKRVEMLCASQAHSQARPVVVAWTTWGTVPACRHSPKPEETCQAQTRSATRHAVSMTERRRSHPKPLLHNSGNVEAVVVPALHPRTKPKALNYALPLARGEYVVIYDAEDRPEPGQLHQALEAFRTGPPNLAAVQARLNLYNAGENWLTRQFTIEYCALFDGMLPTLDRLNLPIPFGGTSNHFRASALAWLMAWDPFNVTEDADSASCSRARVAWCSTPPPTRKRRRG